MDNNKKRNEQLNMPFGTACNRLRKIILFDLLKRYGENICYQCYGVIESVDELSIEHKTPWLDSNDPIGLFFNLDNIAFSHLHCNISAGSGGKHSWDNRIIMTDTERRKKQQECFKRHSQTEEYKSKRRIYAQKYMREYRKKSYSSVA